MAAKTLFALSVWLAVAFAGCASSGAGGAAAATEGPTSPTFGEDKGALHGVVLDDQSLPIEKATIGLMEPALTQTTGPNGAFTFNDLAPGTYTLSALALGYESVSRKVTVTQGQVTDLQLSLVPVAIQAPYHHTIQQAGYVQCTLAWTPGIQTGPAGGTGLPRYIYGLAVCGAFCIASCLPAFSPDKFLLHWTADKGAQEMKYEMQWTSTQAVGKGLLVYVEVEGQPNADGKEYGNRTGTSPLVLEWNATRLQALAKTTGQDCLESKCKLHTRVFGWSNTTELYLPVDPPALGPFGKPDRKIDVGVVVDQRNMQYLTTFHNGPKPAGFTALSDQ
jgi:hypothetical protein